MAACLTTYFFSQTNGHPPSVQRLPDMFQYILKRILLFLPTLLVVSLLAFGLSRMGTGDPVIDFLVEDPFARVSSPRDLAGAKKSYRLAAEKLNLYRPTFYFSITSKAHPDTLYRVITQNQRDVLCELLNRYGNWAQIQAYAHAQEKFYTSILLLPDSIRRNIISAKLELGGLQITSEPPVIESKLGKIEDSINSDSSSQALVGRDFAELKNKWEAVKKEATPERLKVPAFHWHGFDNQYHRWINGFIRGEFGVSVFNRLPVTKKVGPALFWTIVLNSGAILLAFLVSIPLGVWAAVKKGKRTDRVISIGTFTLYSLPAFWIGTLLLIFFSSRAYGMDIFPGPGLGDVDAGSAWWKQISQAAPHLMLPIFCIAYPSLAFISRQMRGSMSSALSQDFVRTARAKGLSERKVIWRHAFRNALFPIITMAASIFPAAIAGSLVIELVFNIPGMGPTLFTAILQKDWPIVLTVLMLGSVLTMAGILVADLLYAIVDPRVRLSSTR